MSEKSGEASMERSENVETDAISDDPDVLPMEERLVILGASLLGGLFVFILYPGSYNFVYQISGALGVAAIIALVTTSIFAGDDIQLLKGVQEAIDEGREEPEETAESQSKDRRICQSCGWKNPEANNYCHDCGTELGG